MVFRRFKMSAESLYDAVRKHNIEEAKYILGQGVPVDIQYVEAYSTGDIYYFTALDVAANNGDLEMVQFLLQYGANPNFKNDNGDTALMGATMESYFICDSSIPYVKSYPEVVQLLIQSGANINIQGSYGYTALMKAAINNQRRCPSVVQILIQAGADINFQNEDGWTALMLAALYRNLEIIQVLLHAGSSVDLQVKNGGTVFDFGNDETKNLITKHQVSKGNITTLNNLRADQSTYSSRIPNDLIGLIKNIFENEIF